MKSKPKPRLGRLLFSSTLVACFLFISAFKSFAQDANAQDSLVLVNIYDSTNGALWSAGKWDLTQPVRSWSGVQLDGAGSVISLRLDGFGLTGSIPSTIGNLNQLNYLSLSSNHFTGGIPSSLGKLSNLITLKIISSELSGDIPHSLGNLSKLKDLELWRNHGLTGHIPSELGNCLQLEILQLFENELTGGIPSTLGNLSALKHLEVATNQLTGSIPPSIGNLANLQSLNLENNQLTGNIPTEIGDLKQLKRLSLSRNKLTGGIPSALGDLVQIQLLWLSSNELSGKVPSSLTNLTNASSGIDISLNKLTFLGMEEIANVQNLFYSNQANIPLHDQNGTLTVSVGGTPINDTFRLFKDGVLDAVQIGDSTFPITATGKYNMVVTNSVATKLTLYSDTLNIVTLPITLTSFTANKSKEFVAINWQTASEQNNKYFIIERSNIGTNFKEIGRVTSKGNSNKTQQYSFIDFSPSSKGNYYRLTQEDVDGKKTSSKVVFAGYDNTIAIKVFPNPAKEVLTIEGLNGNTTTRISIIDMEGKIVAITTTTNDTYKWNTKSLVGGPYYVRIEADGAVTKLKFIKD